MAPLLTVAHRAGNHPDDLRRALDAGVDLIEADVHLYRRALEVRHRKTLGPYLLWDRWELVRRRAAAVPLLDELVGGGGRLMLDLKGLHPGLAPAVAAALPAAEVTVCTRHWWMLAAFADDPRVRPVLSAGSQRGLWRLRARLRRADRPPPFGVSVHRRLLTPVVTAELRAAGTHVLTWPVDDPAGLADARRLGVTGIIGKDLDLLRAAAAEP